MMLPTHWTISFVAKTRRSQLDGNFPVEFRGENWESNEILGPVRQEKNGRRPHGHGVRRRRRRGAAAGVGRWRRRRRRDAGTGGRAADDAARRHLGGRHGGQRARLRRLLPPALAAHHFQPVSFQNNPVKLGTTSYN